MTIITVSQMYWLTRMDHILEVTFPICVIGAIAAGIFTLVLLVDRTENGPNKTSSWLIAGCLWFVPAVSAAVLVFVPTTKEMLVITIVPQVVNNAKVQKVATDSLGIAKDSMKLVDSWIADKTKDLIKEKTK